MNRSGSTLLDVFVAVLALLSHGIAVAGDTPTFNDSTVRVVEPQSGAVVRAGQQVRFVVEVDPALLPGVVAIAGGRANPLGRENILEGPPFSGMVEIPPTTLSGPIRLVVFVSHLERGAVAATEVVLNVLSDDRPTSIEADQVVQLQIGAANRPYDLQLDVSGYYGEEEGPRNHDGPPAGTSFESLTPDIVAVSDSGLLTPNAPGYGFVLVTNGEHEAISEVIVNTADGKRPPAMDRTASVSIRASEFRKEARLLVQELAIKNIGPIPLPKALYLVVSDLPEGVRIQNSMGKARSVDGVLVSVDVEERDFLSPGAIGTATLKVSSSTKMPLKFTSKLYCGTRP